MLLIDHRVMEDIRKESKKFLEANNNENTHTNTQDILKPVQRNRELSTNIKRFTVSNNLMMHPKALENQQYPKDRWEAIIKIRADVNISEANKKTI